MWVIMSRLQDYYLLVNRKALNAQTNHSERQRLREVSVTLRVGLLANEKHCPKENNTWYYGCLRHSKHNIQPLRVLFNNASLVQVG
jgi:hypothetical protein